MRVFAASLILVFFLARDALSQPAAPPCQSVDETVLYPYLGVWQVEWKYRLSRQYQESGAEASITTGLANCAVIEHFSGVLAGKEYQVISTLVVHADGSLSRSRLDTEHAGFSVSEGVVRNDSLIFDMSRRFGERVMRTRHVFGPVTREGFSTHFFMSRAVGEPWTLVEESYYRPVDVDHGSQ